MAHKLLLVISAIALFGFPGRSLAQSSRGENSFIIGGASGFGLASNPCKSCSSSKMIPGITFTATLGYRISENFMIDFGPSIWVEGADMFHNEVPTGERPRNKRMTVTFNGYFYPFESSLAFKLGAGIGTLVYSPERNNIYTEALYINPTEIYSGIAGVAGIRYEWKVGNRILLFPSINISYTSLREQSISYETAINPSRGSLVTDFKCNLYFEF